MPEAQRIHHVTITVTDLDTSVAWYQRLLGLEKVALRTGSGWVRALMKNRHGLVIGLTVHDAGDPGDRFDERRVGLDHLSIACADAGEVEAWRERLDELGVVHDGVGELGYGHVLVARDPDGIAVEFFAPRVEP